MANSVRMKGKSVDEAVESALQVLGLKKEEVDIKIINEAEGGVLGVFGAKEAEVELYPKVSLALEAKEVLQGILDQMKFLTLVSVKTDEPDLTQLDIKGEDMGRIIGRSGATIDALQYITSTILSKRHEGRVRVIVDAEGYRDRRKKIITEDADAVAREVEKSGKEKSLPPMTANERRLVHLYIQENFTNLSSYSRGEGAGRQTVIAPKTEEKA